jgi:hypothetical protein
MIVNRHDSHDKVIDLNACNFFSMWWNGQEGNWTHNFRKLCKNDEVLPSAQAWILKQ